MGDNGNGRGEKFQGYSIETGLQRAVELFRQKYGYDPAEVVKTGGAVKAGPIVETASQEAKEQRGHTVRPVTAEIMGKPPKTHAGGLLRRVAAAEAEATPQRARQLALELGRFGVGLV